MLNATRRYSVARDGQTIDEFALYDEPSYGFHALVMTTLAQAHGAVVTVEDVRAAYPKLNIVLVLDRPDVARVLAAA